MWSVVQKFSGHATRLEEGGGVASGVLSVSRHVWEVECSQQQPLNHLLSLGEWLDLVCVCVTDG